MSSIQELVKNLSESFKHNNYGHILEQLRTLGLAINEEYPGIPLDDVKKQIGATLLDDYESSRNLGILHDAVCITQQDMIDVDERETRLFSIIAPLKLGLVIFIPNEELKINFDHQHNTDLQFCQEQVVAFTKHIDVQPKKSDKKDLHLNLRLKNSPPKSTFEDSFHSPLHEEDLELFREASMTGGYQLPQKQEESQSHHPEPSSFSSDSRSNDKHGENTSKRSLLLHIVTGMLGTVIGTFFGAVIGGVIGLLAGPVGIPVGMAVGAAIGGVIGTGLGVGTSLTIQAFISKKGNQQKTRNVKSQASHNTHTSSSTKELLQTPQIKPKTKNLVEDNPLHKEKAAPPSHLLSESPHTLHQEKAPTKIEINLPATMQPK